MTKKLGVVQPKGDSPEAYEPTAHEKAALERLRERRKRSPPTPRFKVAYDGPHAKIDADHADTTYCHVLAADLFATGDATLSAGLLEQMANVARSGKQLTARELNFALAVVHAIDPRDPTEALLAAQMMAIHNATMAAARRLAHTETITQQDSASNMLNKLARTFAAQLEALKRYRSNGEQVVKVQHVQVTANQAVVGINQGGGAPQKTEDQPHEPGTAGTPTLSDAPSSPLLSHQQTHSMPMPGAGCEGLESVPVPRSKRRSA